MSRRDPEFWEVDCRLVRTSPMAALIETADGKEVWVPRSQIEEDMDEYNWGDTLTLNIADWFCEKEGLL